MIRLLLVDDSPAMRSGLGMLLAATPGMLVVGTCADGAGVLAAADELAPDVVVMDVMMPVMDGITATAELRARHPSVRVLMLTTAVGGDVVHRARDAGAHGYLAKSAPAAVLIDAVRAVAAGRTAWCPRAVEALRHDR